MGSDPLAMAPLMAELPASAASAAAAANRRRPRLYAEQPSALPPAPPTAAGPAGPGPLGAPAAGQPMPGVPMPPGAPSAVSGARARLDSYTAYATLPAGGEEGATSPSVHQTGFQGMPPGSVPESPAPVTPSQQLQV
jgi:hypothetical protein